MIHVSAEQKVDGKHITLTDEPMKEQNAFHMTHIPPIFSPWSVFTRKLKTKQCTTIQSKQL